MLFGLAALLACSNTGCQCCAWSERYMDCVDRISDHEGNAQVLYRPWYDLTRIGRVNWPWACCPKCPPPGFVYDTPVTHQTMSRIDAQEQGFEPGRASPAPPPLLPGELWSQPMEDDDVGVYPLGPLFDPESAPVPPAPDPLEESAFPPMSPEMPPPPPLNDHVEARDPTPALPRIPVSSEIDARNSRDYDWANASGVVNLFDDGARSSSGLRMNQVDHDEFSTIKLDSWLSESVNAPLPAESPATTSNTSEHGSHGEVRPSAGTQAERPGVSTERAQWWEAAPSPNPHRNGTPAPSTSTQNTDDVFGTTGFAEWQSVSE